MACGMITRITLTHALPALLLSMSVVSVQTSNNFKIYLISCVTLTLLRGHVTFVSENETTGMVGKSPFVFLEKCGQPLDKGKRMDDSPVILEDWLVRQQFIANTARDKYQHMPLAVLHSAQARNWDMGTGEYLQLVFSFHRPSHRPQQTGTSGNKWNCSKSVWPELYLHFPCDLKSQCVGGEDETHCFYYSDKCGLGQITAEGSCFFINASLLYWDRYFSLKRTDTRCQKQGAMMATFDSTLQWDTVMTVIETNARLVHEFRVDLQPTKQVVETTQGIYIKNLYLNTWLWAGSTVAYNFHSSFDHQKCIEVYSRTKRPRKSEVTIRPCTSHNYGIVHKNILCRRPTPQHEHHTEKIAIDARMNLTASALSLITCNLGHVTHVMLACDPYSLCSGKLERQGLSQTAMCRASVTHTAPYFRCQATGEYVPYSVVCDWSEDCGYNSDESFCQFPPCGNNTFDCGHRQCVHINQVCDGMVNCKTQRDEHKCKELYYWMNTETVVNVTNSPALINFDRSGGFSLIALPGNGTRCPYSHFQCPGNGYCLPVYTRCNGMNDCPGHEDEVDCDVYTCEGLYRCRGKDRTICMHVNHLCDGWAQCPQHDDELMCPLTQSCPDWCVCYGTMFTNTVIFQADTFPRLRYLEGRGSGLTLDAITNQTMLIYLGVGACGWRNLTDIQLPNLHVIDLSDNVLLYVGFNHFSKLHHLKELDLSGNPLSTGWFGFNTRHTLQSLLLLNLSWISHGFSHLHMLSELIPQIQMIDFRHSKLVSLQGKNVFPHITILNLQGCSISDFSHDFMKGMDKLQHMVADNFKLCCPAVLPDSFLGKCTAPADEISSCDNLLKSASYRAALIIFALTAVLGNLGSFVYRLWSSSTRRKTGYAVFVIHLSVSDFFMGVYLLIIGVADRVYADSYLWNESSWKTSTACSISGFISLLSCEVSSITICLITLDRFMVVCFPFSRLRFGSRSAHLVCIANWVLGTILATIPLLPVTSHWAFYSQTGICIPLPVTRADFPGHHYSFSVMIVFNLVIFVLIAVGQALIYWSVRSNTLSHAGSKNKDDATTHSNTRSKEVIIARRLLTIAMSDFVCWFPIGVCGLLAKLNVPIPGEVNTAMAVFVLPFNSALNPFLYTYTIMQEKSRKEKETQLQMFMTAQIKIQVAAINR